MIHPAPKPPGKRERAAAQTARARADQRRRAEYKRAHPICEFVDAVLDKEGRIVAEKACGEATADLVHLEHRRMGGTKRPEIETEENWMAGCRRHHGIYDHLERGWRVTKHKLEIE